MRIDNIPTVCANKMNITSTTVQYNALIQYYNILFINSLGFAWDRRRGILYIDTQSLPLLANFLMEKRAIAVIHTNI